MNLFEDPGRDGSRSPKFPKELLTALGTKLQNIAMNRDPGYESTTQMEGILISSLQQVYRTTATRYSRDLLGQFTKRPGFLSSDEGKS